MLRYSYKILNNVTYTR